jgi:MFS family permease
VLLLIMWRTLTQVMGGATMPSSLALINSEYQGKERAKAMGWWAMVAAGAPVLGLALGAPLIDSIGWQALFVLQAAIMTVPVAASWLVLRETPRRDARFDIAGAATLAVAVGTLMVAVNEALDWGIAHPIIVTSAVVSPIAFGAFIAIERRVEAPLLPLEFFRRRDFAASISSSFFSSAAYMGAFFLASLLMLEQFGYSLTGAVPILTVRPVLFALASPVGGRLAGRVGNRVTAAAGNVALLVGLVGLAIGASKHSLAIVVGVGFIMQGIGYGILRPPTTTALANSVDQGDLGIAAAAERLTGQIGVAFGITLLATIYDGDVSKFSLGFAVGAVLAALGAVTALMMHRGRPQAPAPSLVDVARDETAYEETALGVPVVPALDGRDHE